MRRTPAGQIQKFYKRLFDLYQRYPKRWTQEKGYGDADYYEVKTKKLLMALKAGLEGRPLPGTEAPQMGRHRAEEAMFDYAAPGPEHLRGRYPGQRHFPQYEDDDGHQGYGPPPVQRRIAMTRSGSFIPKSTKSKSRSVRPSFLRKR